MKSWTGTPPSPWVLDSSGVISGTAPILEGGTTLRVHPAFTVTVIAEERHAWQTTYTITVIKKAPELTLKTISVTWDKNKPPSSSYLFLATTSGGIPPYGMAAARSVSE
jgi:hypothetical protein